MRIVDGYYTTNDTTAKYYKISYPFLMLLE